MLNQKWGDLTPKMDGENNGKPYEQMDDLGVPLVLETSISYHGKNHNFSPPFGRTCLELVPSIEEANPMFCRPQIVRPWLAQAYQSNQLWSVERTGGGGGVLEDHPMTCKWLTSQGDRKSPIPGVILLPNGRNLWLINGAYDHHLRYLGWSSKLEGLHRKAVVLPRFPKFWGDKIKIFQKCWHSVDGSCGKTSWGW